jgi:hypothetical protein
VVDGRVLPQREKTSCFTPLLPSRKLRRVRQFSTLNDAITAVVAAARFSARPAMVLLVHHDEPGLHSRDRLVGVLQLKE